MLAVDRKLPNQFFPERKLRALAHRANPTRTQAAWRTPTCAQSDAMRCDAMRCDARVTSRLGRGTE